MTTPSLYMLRAMATFRAFRAIDTAYPLPRWQEENAVAMHRVNVILADQMADPQSQIDRLLLLIDELKKAKV